MRILKVGLANVNTTVGAFESNMRKVMLLAEAMAKEECDLACFQEQVISGYPAEDYVQWKGFSAPQIAHLMDFAERTANFSCIFTLGLTVEHASQLYNAIAVVAGGKILGIVPKEWLPTYGVFYEGRVFSGGKPGWISEIAGIPFGDLIFRFPCGIMAVEVCEDIWTPDGPMKGRAYSGAEIIINGSASPYRAGILETRREMISTRAADNQVTIIYTNQIGGNDALVFDGGGFVNQNGWMIHESPRWQEGYTTTIVDLNRTSRLRAENTTWRVGYENFMANQTLAPKIIESDFCLTSCLDKQSAAQDLVHKSFFLPSPSRRLDPREEYFTELCEATTLGLKDYFEKSGAFRRIIIALSGGKDSALALILAWLYAQKRFSGLPEGVRKDALRDFIICYSLPTRFNSDITKNIAKELAEELGVGFNEVSVDGDFIQAVRTVKIGLPKDAEIPAITFQNIQARVRGSLMWNWSNAQNALWIQTGNMSEKAVGYTTIGGDMMGGYSLLGNMPKTVVIALLHHLYSIYKWPSLGKLLQTKASAELAENQEDEKDLMPFPVLDACFALFAGEKLMPAELYKRIYRMWDNEELKAMRPDYKTGMLKEWVKKFVVLFMSSIFKWVQAPQAVHLGSLDLDRERALQLPVVKSLEWLRLAELDALPDGRNTKLQIAVIGGSFSPPHLGHFKIAQAVAAKFDKVIIVPCGTRHDKPSTAMVEPHQRKEMILLAFKNIVNCEFNFHDLSNNVFTPHYLLAERYARKYPNADIWFVVGGDLVSGGKDGKAEIQGARWQKGQEVWQNLNFAVITHELCPVDPRDLPPKSQLIEVAGILGRSSQIRELIAVGDPFDQLVTTEVAEYIQEHLLYGLCIM